MRLSEIPLARRAFVKAVSGTDSLSIRLMEMGLIEGAVVSLLGRAPFGDPLRVRLGDYDLSLRASEAGRVEVALA